MGAHRSIPRWHRLPARLLTVAAAVLAWCLTVPAEAAFLGTSGNPANGLSVAAAWGTYPQATTAYGASHYYRNEQSASSSATVAATDSSGNGSNGTHNGRTDGALSWHSFSEGSGTSAYDNSGNHLTATAQGTTAWATGISGNAVDFTGNGYYKSTSPVDTTQSFTVTAWAYLTSSATGSPRTVVSQIGTDSSAYILKLVYNSGWRWYATMPRDDIDNPGNDETYVSATNGTPTNQWNHVALVYNDSANRLYLYVNGSGNTSNVAKSNEWNATGGMVVGGARWAGIGGVGASYLDTFAGRVDDVQTYQRALSASEIDSIYDNPGTAYAPFTAQRTGALGGSQSSTKAIAYAGTAGTYTPATQANPTTFSTELWFKATGGLGGGLAGFCNTQTGAGASVDRVVYLDSGGRISYVVNTTTLRSPSAYNDGAWHHLVATYTSTSMVLYVDGASVANTGSPAAPENITGYWRFGGTNLTGMSNRPARDYFVGTLDELAVYPGQLSAGAVTFHYGRRNT
ncbi:hypothetical protein GCM10010123_32470 [Pilimelia anulata]|uniref:LamG-like jellyroll fold domain-containing protein n=1 Tax=Pilimelia anulata TaxID=53371 RepID=A0A8J3BA45_9ACTN|nr:LamG domain-containing protein [Pilimelia anulata]GGK00105.1 hypothetical protein GCM10010123_32470 [Pilimelia anulata]